MFTLCLAVKKEKITLPHSSLIAFHFLLIVVWVWLGRRFPYYASWIEQWHSGIKNLTYFLVILVATARRPQYCSNPPLFIDTQSWCIEEGTAIQWKVTWIEQYHDKVENSSYSSRRLQFPGNPPLFVGAQCCSMERGGIGIYWRFSLPQVRYTW